MTMLRIFDRQFMQTELVCHMREFAGTGLFQCNPNERVGHIAIGVDIVDIDVREFPAVLISRAIDQHGAPFIVISMSPATRRWALEVA
jgi:hypothetical protein